MISRLNPLRNLILLLTILKIGISLMNFDFSRMHSDEERNYNIALNYKQGHDYSVTTDNITFRLSSFHGSFTVFLYKYFIENNIRKESWILFYFIISNIFYSISLFYFYKISTYFLSDQLSLLSTFLYGVYPSVLFYIGSIFFYENIVLYFLLIVIYYLLKWYTTKNISNGELIWISTLIVLSCILRGQMIFVYMIIFSSYLLANFQKKINVHKLFKLSFLTILLLGITHYPVLQKNHKMFNAYIISTQPGFEFLQGHSPVARGSWYGKWEYPDNELYIYAHENIPGLDTLNEYQSSVKRAKLGFSWLKNNPLKDFQLEIKKMAIYFLPYNFELLPFSNKINPFNLIIHLGFGIYCCYLIFFKRNLFNTQLLIILLPIIASLLICICFFSGYRWRFYGEPFMILTVIILLSHLKLLPISFKSSK